MMRRAWNWARARRRKLESDLERELRYHVERRMQDFEREGLNAGEARRRALAEIGGVEQVREEVRDEWLARWARDFAYDLRYAARSLARTPAFTLTAVASLALGIGSAAAIYSMVDQVLLHALPVRDPQRLVLVDWDGEQVASGFGSWDLMSYPICREMDKQKQFFDGVFCRALTRVNFSSGGEFEPEVIEVVSGNYFGVLGVGAAAGRVLAESDDGAPGASPVAVISYDYWKLRMGGARDIAGRKIWINRQPFTVVGVAAEGFRGVDVGEVPVAWTPAAMSAEAIPGFTEYLSPRQRWMQVLGRLADGMTRERAQVGLGPWFRAMLDEDMKRADFPKVSAETRREYLASKLVLKGAAQGHSSLRRRLVKPLWVLMAATGVLLGLACLNVSGLFLARGSAREREMGTRLALGASRGRLGRGCLADSLLIGAAGGLLGTAAAPVALRGLIALLADGQKGTALNAAIDGRLLGFAVAASVAAGIVSGLAPAWASGRRGVTEALRERGGTAGGARLRRAIVTGQMALTLVLVAEAALFARTLERLMTKGPGFATAGMVTFRVEPTRGGYTAGQTRRLMERLEEAVRRSPVTVSVGVEGVPLLTGGSWNDPMTIQTDRRFETDRDMNLNAVTPEFFPTMGIRIVAGRNFDERDEAKAEDAGALVAIVNEAFVKRYMGGRSPLGARIGEGTGPDKKAEIEIVGVMSDFSYRGIREESEMAVFPFRANGGAGGTFYVKVRGAGPAAMAALRDAVRRIAPELPMLDFRTVDEQVDRSLTTERALASLAESFSGAALALSLVGLYGVMSFVVARRRKEIGIRMALGARRGSAVWLVMKDALAMIVPGAAAGLAAVWGMGRLVEAVLYGVTPMDAGALGAAIGLLALAGLGAAAIPARRASGVDPAEALRAE